MGYCTPYQFELLVAVPEHIPLSNCGPLEEKVGHPWSRCSDSKLEALCHGATTASGMESEHFYKGTSSCVVWRCLPHTAKLLINVKINCWNLHVFGGLVLDILYHGSSLLFPKDVGTYRGRPPA